MLLLLIRSKEFFMTVLCLSIIFFRMLQIFTRPDLRRNHFTEANLLRFPHCLAAPGPGTTHLCPTPASHMLEQNIWSGDTQVEITPGATPGVGKS